MFLKNIYNIKKYIESFFNTKYTFFQPHAGLFMRPDDANLYTTLEPTLSTNPNVYFQRGGGVHPGMMY